MKVRLIMVSGIVLFLLICITLWLFAPGVPFLEILEENQNNLQPLSHYGRPFNLESLIGYYYNPLSRRLFPCRNQAPNPEEIKKAKVALGHFIQYLGTSDLNYFRSLSLSPDSRLSLNLDSTLPYNSTSVYLFGPHELIRLVEPISIKRFLGRFLIVQYQGKSHFLWPGRSVKISSQTKTFSREEFKARLLEVSPELASTSPDAEDWLVQLLGTGNQATFTTQVKINYQGKVKPMAKDLLSLYRQATRLANSRQFTEASIPLNEFLSFYPNHQGALTLLEEMEKDKKELGKFAELCGNIFFPALTAEQKNALTQIQSQVGDGWLSARLTHDPEDVVRYSLEIVGNHYSMYLPQNEYALTLSIPGFRPLQQIVTVNREKIELDFKLTEESIILRALNEITPE